MSHSMSARAEAGVPQRRLLHATAVLALALGGSQAAAQFAPGVPVYTFGPFTQLGTSTGTSLLTLSTSPYDISLVGQFRVTVAPGFVAGTLASWEISRPLLPSFTLNSYTTVTSLLGFSAPPAGTFGPTSGHVSTYIVDNTNTVVPGTTSNVLLTLTNGGAVWNGPPVSSTAFSFTTGTGYKLVQRFDLDGVQTSGPGGIWIVDVPLYSGLVPVPEPATAWLWLGGAAALLLRAGRARPA